MTRGFLSPEQINDACGRIGVQSDLFDVVQIWIELDHIYSRHPTLGDMPATFHSDDNKMKVEWAFQDPGSFSVAMLMAGWCEDINSWDTRFTAAVA